MYMYTMVSRDGIRLANDECLRWEWPEKEATQIQTSHKTDLLHSRSVGLLTLEKYPTMWKP